jgi:hypothetical protein
MMPGAHALSEYVRNLAYAIIGALVFHWVLVQVPEERRRRLTYESREQVFQLLVQAPASLVELIRLMARQAKLPEAEIDSWDRRSLRSCLESLDRDNAAHLRSTVPLLTTILGSLQLSLDTLESSAPFVHEDVAQALALYPATKGLHQVQPPPPDMAFTANRWEHVTWELLEAARRLQFALREDAPYLDLKIEGGQVALATGETSNPKLSDVERNSGV